MPRAAPFLLAAVGLLLLLLFLFPGLWALAALAVLLLLPGRWWRWRTRRFRRGVRAIRQGKPLEARGELEAFLREIEGDEGFERVQPWFNLGQRYSYRAAAESNLGVTWLQAGDAGRALRHFLRAREVDPANAQAAFGEAAARRCLGQLADAERAAARAVELRPTYLPARLVLAAVRRARGDEAGAEEALAPVRREGKDPQALLERLDAQWPRGAGGGRG